MHLYLVGFSQGRRDHPECFHFYKSDIISCLYVTSSGQEEEYNVIVEPSSVAIRIYVDQYGMGDGLVITLHRSGYGSYVIGHDSGDHGVLEGSLALDALAYFGDIE